jgi:transglutaminase-like putative cysteine protease
VDPFTRKLFVKHRTEFSYTGSASENVNEVRLGPVDGPRQHVEYARLTVTPSADVAESIDLWGNRVWWCQIVDHHTQLIVEAESVILTRDVIRQARAAPQTAEWAKVQAGAYQDAWAEFLLPSELVAWSPRTGLFAEQLAVPRDRGLASWVTHLAATLNAALIYERGATDVTTTVDGVITAGRGVCQDFAHVYLALCRQNGLAARYVSGWLFEPDHEGPVESHAWVEVNIPGLGWVEEDPTHPGGVSDRYVRIGCGRDYSDVVPIKGTYLGGVTESMTVSVELRDVGTSPALAVEV